MVWKSNIRAGGRTVGKESRTTYFESKKTKISVSTEELSESSKENEIRGDEEKNGHKSILAEDADVIFLGETKCNEWPVDLESAFRTKGYHRTLLVSQKNKGGYAGVALLTKIKPLKIWKGLDSELFADEGRLIIAEFTRFYFIGACVPNSGRGLVNLGGREKWEELFLEKIKDLDSKKPVIYAGDLNVAHNEIDLANPDSNRNKTAGFTDQERGWFTRLLGAGFKDTYRELHGDKQEYTFWSYMGNARSRNIGWRLDYYVVSDRIFEKVKSSEIRTDVMGSDHAPVVLEIDI
ncbi:exodeoxyribonuclease III [Teladorsagia circumcincta]|uniref:exodeoxyribonuclease III n=1 Tax=Teladorsagia circumcincta TaxID=45464 RepID=A0A2G9UP67_TELCI|nr:exodeoxyribonuclease III [Teladorsagia circumcincta]